MMTTRVVETEADRKLLYRFVATRKLPFTVSIEQGRKRSTDQNRLQRLWQKEVAEQLGDRSPEDVRAYCKLHFGVPIRRAASEAFAEAYDRDIRPLPYELKLRLMATPHDYPVTRDMTAKQHTDYLDAMHAHFTGEGIVLTDPDALARAA